MNTTWGALFMNASAALAHCKQKSNGRPDSPLRKAWTRVARRPGSPRAASTYCFKYTSAPRGSVWRYPLSGDPLRPSSCNGSIMQWVQRLATAGYPLRFSLQWVERDERHE